MCISQFEQPCEYSSRQAALVYLFVCNCLFKIYTYMQNLENNAHKVQVTHDRDYPTQPITEIKLKYTHTYKRVSGNWVRACRCRICSVLVLVCIVCGCVARLCYVHIIV